MRHRPMKNKVKTTDTDSNIATVIMLIIIISGIAIGVYYLQKYNLINLVPESTTNEKTNEKDKTSGNLPG